MIISICGLEGSGKDTVGKELARRLGHKFYSIGDLFGEMAKKKGMGLVEYHEYCERDDIGDREVDKYQEELGEKDDNFVIVSRLGAHFIPHAFKVLLKVELEEGTRRIFQDLKNRHDESYSNLEETRESIKKRQKSNEKRYMKLYRVNPYDEKGYDLVIDTTHITAMEVVEQILGELRKTGKI